jgi:hypothetical protein
MIAPTGVGPPGPQNDCAPGGETGGGNKSVNGGEPIDQSLPLAARIVNTRARVRRLRAEYQLLCKVQAPIERAFSALEQRKGQLGDQLANEGIKPFCRPRRSGHPPSKRKPGF